MSDDLISRQAAIDAVCKFYCENSNKNCDVSDKCGLRCVICQVPSEQPKTGRWILDTTQFLPEYVCANCKSRFPLVASEGEFYSTLCCKNMNYCPNCGAKMEGYE